MKKRVAEGLSEIGKGHHALFCHAGVLEILLNEMGFFGMEINNCGMLGVKVDNKGLPLETLGFWSPKYLDH